MNEINISITKTALIILTPIVIYLVANWYYKNVLHPDYRWNQKGNVCHEAKRVFSFMVTIILSIAIVFAHALLINYDFKFTW